MSKHGLSWSELHAMQLMGIPLTSAWERVTPSLAANVECFFDHDSQQAVIEGSFCALLFFLSVCVTLIN
jgi:hypothetical protein